MKIRHGEVGYNDGVSGGKRVSHTIEELGMGFGFYIRNHGSGSSQEPACSRQHAGVCFTKSFTHPFSCKIGTCECSTVDCTWL